MATKYRALLRRKHYIQEWIEGSPLNQREIADKMNTSESNVTRWLSDPDRITLDVLSGFANALDLPDVGALFRHPAEHQALVQLRKSAAEIAAIDGE